MSLQGDLDTIPLADIFQMIGNNARDGTLYIASEKGGRVLTFQRGGITTGSALEQRFTLGKILIERGVVDPEALFQALDLQKEDPRPLGEILLGLGALTEDQLGGVIGEQIQTIMNDVLTWPRGGFLFVEENPDDPMPAYPVQSMLMEALRSSDEGKELHEQYGDPNLVPEFVPESEMPDDVGAITHGSMDSLNLMEKIDGSSTVDSLIERAGWNEYRVLSALNELFEGKIIRFKRADPSIQLLESLPTSFAHYIPVMPRAAGRAVAMATIEEPTPIDLREIALSDPGLAMSLIRTCGALTTQDNSVTSITEAIESLRPEVTRRALVAGGLRGLYTDADHTWLGLWRHSNATAVAAGLVSRMVTDDSTEIETARLTGLVHDIGCYILRRLYPTEYEKVFAESRITLLIDAERKNVGMGHDRVGAKALETWGASPDIFEAVRKHHSMGTEFSQLGAVLVVANAIANKNGFIASETMLGDDPFVLGKTLLNLPQEGLEVLEKTFIRICAAKGPLW